jgi:hypothetical protein
MDELPSNAVKTLPSHNVMTKNGSNEDKPCVGGEVTEVFSDVGLLYGACPKCAASFVYIEDKNTWMLEQDFEKILLEEAPKMTAIAAF